MKKAIQESSIIEVEDDEDLDLMVDLEAQKKRILQIISHQKYLYLSSSSSSSSSSSDLSRTNSSSSRSSSSLEDLMKAGGLSLRRRFEEHTELAIHPEDHCDTPMGRPLLQSGSDSDDSCADSPRLSPIKPFRMAVEGCRADSPIMFPLEYSLTGDGDELGSPKMILRSEWRLPRKRSPYKRSGIWRSRSFRFRLRPRRLKIIICGRRS